MKRTSSASDVRSAARATNARPRGTLHAGLRPPGSPTSSRPRAILTAESFRAPVSSTTTRWYHPIEASRKMAPLSHVTLAVTIAAAIPFALTSFTKSSGFSLKDNHETRVWQEKLQGRRQRAYWAHQNTFETLPIFIGAAILAYLGSPHSPLFLYALYAYPACRVVYSVAFIADLASLRSLVWMASMASIVVLLWVAFRF